MLVPRMNRSLSFVFFLLAACGSDSSNPGGNSVGDGGNADAGLNNSELGDASPQDGSPGDGGDLNDGGPGDAAADGSPGAQDAGPIVCGHTITATIRDFKPCTTVASGTDCSSSTGHLDFEHYTGPAATTGIVANFLDADSKPVYVGTGPHLYQNDPNLPQTTGPAEFAQWYRTVPQTLTRNISLTEASPGSGRFVYQSDAFFPIDGTGWGNGPTIGGSSPHNFSFTTEVHEVFTYKGGESFTFTGDDDMWLFINKKLALDLGGVHPQLSATVNLDTLGLTKGQRYSLDLFHAERHTVESHFSIDTTIDCLDSVPIIIH